MRRETAKVIVVMGVAGSGKTTVGEEVARRLGFGFADADQFHSEANREKMGAGIPLTDEDREPWLQAMRDAIESWVSTENPHVLACSALKHSYRDLLRVAPSVWFVFLDASRDLIYDRLSHRKHHYMKANMLDSQFATLEKPSPEEAIIVSAELPLEKIVQEIIEKYEAAQQPADV